ncbi:MAG: hypothetical protein AAF620_08400 [Bacteroidota bacterium]
MKKTELILTALLTFTMMFILASCEKDNIEPLQNTDDESDRQQTFYNASDSTIVSSDDPACINSNPVEPTFSVEADGNFEVCKGEIFGAYSTENIGSGFLHHEWVYPSDIIVPMSGYSNNDSNIKFRVIGNLYEGFYIILKAYYCKPEGGAEVRTSSKWSGAIQNCSGRPKI